MAAFEQFGRITSRLLDAPMAVIALGSGPQDGRIASLWGLSGEASESAATICRTIVARAELGALSLPHGAAPLRAGAAAALLDEDGARIGVICVFDRRTRAFSVSQLGLLESVAQLVSEHIGFARRNARDTEWLATADATGSNANAEESPAISLESALTRALAADTVELRFAPMVDRAAGVRGAEAFVVWDHPEVGRLTHRRFMAAAETAGLVLPIGRWMLARACRFAARWSAQGGSGRVAVDVSARLCRERNFVATVMDAIDAAGIVPAQLCLEIAEAALGRNADAIAPALAQLRSCGVQTAIDDFAGGSLGMHHLRGLPIDRVKIDRVFVSGATGEPDAALLAAVVSLARALGLEVGAQGIETDAQLALALRSGCDIVQGELIAPAMTEERLLYWSLRSDARASAGWAASPAESDARAHVHAERSST